ncbi:EscU/YscU/HrcU family type III secretion system export apparatus switch protein [Mesorhizobium atlanticum]
MSDQPDGTTDRAEICAWGGFAPIVLAKGQDLVAPRIREIARENNILIFEDAALARSMYKQVPVDSVIPSYSYSGGRRVGADRLLEEGRPQGNPMNGRR